MEKNPNEDTNVLIAQKVFGYDVEDWGFNKEEKRYIGNQIKIGEQMGNPVYDDLPDYCGGQNLDKVMNNLANDGVQFDIQVNSKGSVVVAVGEEGDILSKKQLTREEFQDGNFSKSICEAALASKGIGEEETPEETPDHYMVDLERRMKQAEQEEKQDGTEEDRQLQTDTEILPDSDNETQSGDASKGCKNTGECAGGCLG